MYLPIVLYYNAMRCHRRHSALTARKGWSGEFDPALAQQVVHVDNSGHGVVPGHDREHGNGFLFHNIHKLRRAHVRKGVAGVAGHYSGHGPVVLTVNSTGSSLADLRPS